MKEIRDEYPVQMRLEDHEKNSDYSLSSAVTQPVISFMKDQGTKDEGTRLVS